MAVGLLQGFDVFWNTQFLSTPQNILQLGLVLLGQKGQTMFNFFVRSDEPGKN